MFKVIVFAGTTEGRIIAEELSKRDIKSLICTATEYGESLIVKNHNTKVLSKRLDCDEMKALFNENKCLIVVDATHPYATEVSNNIKIACENVKCRYIRVIRETSNIDTEINFENIESAIKFLDGTSGNILATTGSKELEEYTKLDNYKNRVFARVLSAKESIEKSTRLGFEGKNLICMQGPFNEELNYAMIKQIDAKYMVTKESGSNGGFAQKVSAAKRAGAKLIVIDRPNDEIGFNIEGAVKEVIEIINEVDSDTDNNVYIEKQNLEKTNIDKNENCSKRKLTLAGIGMGNEDTMLNSVKTAILNAEVIIGASRMINTAKGIFADINIEKPVFESYKKDEIKAFLERNYEYKNIVVLMSGDTGFFSGAKGFRDYFSEYEVLYLCGVSSLSFFMSRLGKSWNDVKVTSLHGISDNIIDIIRTNRKVFSILGKADDIEQLFSQISYYEFENLDIWLGENLGTSSERIRKLNLDEIKEFEYKEIKELCVLYIENSSTDLSLGSLCDDEFIRDKVPMTKEEVRAVSIAKLNLQDDSIIWDIGAGTGSVSIEIARKAVNGKVYAFEKNPDAIKLIKANSKKFKVSNVEIIEGSVPNIDVVEGLASNVEIVEGSAPNIEVAEGLASNIDIQNQTDRKFEIKPPTHCFIGGSGGNLDSIINWVLEKNPKTVFVINIIALETLAEMINLLKNNNLNYEIVQILIAKAKEIGKYNLMSGQNPVYIIKFWRETL